MGNPNQPRDKRGRWTKGGGFTLAAVVTASIGVAAVGGGASGTSASGSGKGGPRSSSSQAKAANRDVARLVRRLQNSDLRVEPIATSADQDCAANSYGRIRVYFSDHPCSALFRVLLRVTDRNRAVAVVAVATVDMPDSSQAGTVKSTVDDYGTGNITELRSRRVPAVDWTGRHYVSELDDTTVVNAQAEPIGRTAAATALAELASRAVTRPE